jgi:putative membrane protein
VTLTRVLALALIASASAIGARAAAASPADLAFVAKVSQGGLYEVEAGKVATQAGSTQDVRDFAVMEVHEHTLVGDKLKSISASENVPIAPKLNAMFQAKLDHLKSLPVPRSMPNI